MTEESTPDDPGETPNPTAPDPIPRGASSSAASPARSSRAPRRSSGRSPSFVTDPRRRPRCSWHPGAGRCLAAAPQPACEPPGAPTGFRTPFRFESDNVLLVIDQRKLPDELVEVPVRSGSDAASAIRRMVVRGAPAIGQVAAIGLALTARIATPLQRAHAPRDPRGRRGQLRTARPTAVNLRWAVDRLMARYHAIGDLSEDGEAIAGAMFDEAMAIVAEATDDHGRLAEAGPRVPARVRRPAADPDPLQHRAAGLRPVRDGARHRAGRPRGGAAAPRLGRRDPAVPPGRPAHGLGAPAGGRPAHAHPGHGGGAAHGPRRGRRGPRRRRSDRGERRHGEQDRDVHARGAGCPPRHPVRRLRAAVVGRSRDARRRGHPDRGSIRGRGHRHPRRPDRARGDERPQPRLRRHASGADLRRSSPRRARVRAPFGPALRDAMDRREARRRGERQPELAEVAG